VDSSGPSGPPSEDSHREPQCHRWLAGEWPHPGDCPGRHDTGPSVPEHVCETSRCWQDCRNRPPRYAPVTLSPGSVTCYCGWGVIGGDDDMRLAAFQGHVVSAHTTEKESNDYGILATIKRWLRRR
jgi:hypothetical protein